MIAYHTILFARVCQTNCVQLIAFPKTPNGDEAFNFVLQIAFNIAIVKVIFTIYYLVFKNLNQIKFNKFCCAYKYKQLIDCSRNNLCLKTVLGSEGVLLFVYRKSVRHEPPSRLLPRHI